MENGIDHDRKRRHAHVGLTRKLDIGGGIEIGESADVGATIGPDGETIDLVMTNRGERPVLGEDLEKAGERIRKLGIRG
ncbi:MAG TPA: hypothetical protein VG733_18000 [Chthoniobacteraceae bacterium]|nr:hypothetical protein [Chthoniobacteraceae bacterium]